MSTVWNCSNCHLTNSYQNKHCQACFTPITISYKTDHIQTEEEAEHELETNFEMFANNSFSEDEDISMEYTLSLSETNISILPNTKLLGATTHKNDKFDSKSSVNPEIISKLINKQRILFDGFLRFESGFEIIFIPFDILNLCFEFFQLNITTICKNIHRDRASIYSIQIKLDSENNILSYDDLYELAMILRSEKNCFIAYELMKELIATQPNLSEYHNAMGLILKRWHCFDLAEIYYAKAIDIEPKENIYKWNYGLLLEERMKFDLALKHFLDASENSDKKEPDFVFEAAYCYQKLKDYNNATINYLKAIEMNCNKSTYWIYYAEYLCEDLKQYKDSIKCFEKAIQLDNENINYYYRYARYLRDFHKNYNLSKIYYLKCLDMNTEKEIKGVNGSFGYLLFLTKEYEESNKYLSLAQISDPNNAWTYFYFGLLHCSYFNNKQKAYQLLYKAIECCHGKLSIQKHLDRIKKVNINNIEFHNKFQSLLNEKFDC